MRVTSRRKLTCLQLKSRLTSSSSGLQKNEAQRAENLVALCSWGVETGKTLLVVAASNYQYTVLAICHKTVKGEAVFFFLDLGGLWLRVLWTSFDIVRRSPVHKFDRGYFIAFFSSEMLPLGRTTSTQEKTSLGCTASLAVSESVEAKAGLLC